MCISICQGRAAVFIFHFKAAAGIGIHPVQIRVGIGNLGTDLIKISICGFCQCPGCACGNAAGGKIGN